MKGERETKEVKAWRRGIDFTTMFGSEGQKKVGKHHSSFDISNNKR